MTVDEFIEIIPTILTYDGPVLAFVLLVVVIRARRLLEFHRFLNELDRVKSLLGKRQSWSESALELTLSRMDEVKTCIREQSKILARVRASASISEHLDVIEKVVLVSEQLEKLKTSVEQTFHEAIERDSTIRQDRTREIHGHFKISIEQARKNLEKSITDKVASFAGDKGRDELMGHLVNPLRHALLSISKQNLDSLQACSSKSREDSERNIRQSLGKVCAMIDELRQKYDDAPMMIAGVQESPPVQAKKD